jgi:hypothetical protein
VSMLECPPLSLRRLDFPDLYARRLRRHSQFGINVVHLIALFGVWFDVHALLYHLTGAWWLPVGMAVGYLGLAVRNAPPRVCVATALFLIGFIAAILSVPPLWPWV